MNDCAGALAGTVVPVDAALEREFSERLSESLTLVLRVADGVLRNREDAEDVAQEACVRAYRRFSRRRERDRFRAWLVRITWRLAIDRWRARQRRAARESVVDLRETRTAEQVAQDRQRTTLLDAIDREVRSARAIDPSPEFSARIRARIAAESHACGWWPRRVRAAAAGSLVVTLGALLLIPALRPGDPAVRPERSSPGETATAHSGAAIGADEGPGSPTARRVDSPHRARFRPPTRSASMEPEVLVPAAQAEAVPRLVRAVAEGRLNLPAPAAGVSDVAPVSIPPLGVRPVPIPPIKISAASPETVGSR